MSHKQKKDPPSLVTQVPLFRQGFIVKHTLGGTKMKKRFVDELFSIVSACILNKHEY